MVLDILLAEVRVRKFKISLRNVVLWMTIMNINEIFFFLHSVIYCFIIWTKVWNKIISNEKNALQELLPNKINRPLRQRGHEFELPLVRTERYKRSFLNIDVFLNSYDSL